MFLRRTDLAHIKHNDLAMARERETINATNTLNKKNRERIMKVDKHIRDAAEKWVQTESIAKDTYEVERAFKAGAKYVYDILNQANDATDNNGTCAIGFVVATEGKCCECPTPNSERAEIEFHVCCLECHKPIKQH